MATAGTTRAATTADKLRATMNRTGICRLIAAILLTTTMLCSCNNNIVYDHYESTSLEGWARNDTISFAVPAVTASGDYETSLGMRINSAFPFMSITMIVERNIIPRHMLITDTLTCPLIDKKGKPLGQGLNFFQYTFPLKDVALSEGDSVAIKVRHDMRMEMLPGVADIGIRLTKK